MGISTKFSRAYSPLSARDKGTLIGWMPSSSIPAGGRPNAIAVEAGIIGGYLVAPEATGGRVGDGTGLSDPYGYENDATTLCDYKPRVTGGVIPSKVALRFGPGLIGPDVNNFADNTNTGVASQAPDTPGQMLVPSATADGADDGFTGAAPQPLTYMEIHKYHGTKSGFLSIFEFNGVISTGGTKTQDGYFTQCNGRLTKQNDAVGANDSVYSLDTIIPVDTWGGVIWRSEPDRPRAYSIITGLELPTTATQAGVWTPQSATGIVGNRVHSMASRRYSQVASDPARLRQRGFSNVTIQEVLALNELVNPRRIAEYVRNTYPGIEQVVAF